MAVDDRPWRPSRPPKKTNVASGELGSAGERRHADADKGAQRRVDRPGRGQPVGPLALDGDAVFRPGVIEQAGEPIVEQIEEFAQARIAFAHADLDHFAEGVRQDAGRAGKPDHGLGHFHGTAAARPPDRIDLCRRKPERHGGMNADRRIFRVDAPAGGIGPAGPGSRGLLGGHGLDDSHRLEEIVGLRPFENIRFQRRIRSPARAGHVLRTPLRPFTRAVRRENELTLA